MGDPGSNYSPEYTNWGASTTPDRFTLPAVDFGIARQKVAPPPNSFQNSHFFDHPCSITLRYGVPPTPYNDQ